jgi:alkylation response protein AidB-like acyl-CoA dehydrogenase
LRDAGAFSKEASVAKLVATDAAMKVTTDAVQVSAARIHAGFPAERWFRHLRPR